MNTILIVGVLLCIVIAALLFHFGGPKLRRLLIIGIPVLILGIALVYRFGLKRASAAELGKTAARKNSATNAVIGRAKSRDVVQTVEILGAAQSPYDVKISPKATGVIEYLTVREGDKVTAGQVVARVDSDEINGQVIQAQSALAEAQHQLAQAKITLNPTAVGVFSQIRQQSAVLASNQAEYNQTAQNYAAQVAAAKSSVVDANAKVASANSQVESAAAQVQSAQANLDDAQAKYNRTYTLYKQAFVAAQDVDDASAAYKVQLQAKNVADKALDAAKSALHSAEAERDATVNQADITILKGKADVLAAKALVTQAQATLKTASSNRAQIPAYEQNLRALQAAVDAANANLIQAKSRLFFTSLTSPIDGIVTQRSADPGAVANPGTAILDVQYLKWLYVTGSVPVEDSSLVHVGMPVTIKFDALPNKSFAGTIDRLNPSADPTNRQFTIYAKLDNSEDLLRPGMYAKIDIITSKVHADVVVPREAVTQGTSGPTVTVVKSDYTADIVPVKTGVEDAAGIQILSGVDPGAMVVVRTYTPIKQGQKIAKPAAKGSKGGSAAGPGSGQTTDSTSAPAGGKS
jgi:HlyD family secretion protein